MTMVAISPGFAMKRGPRPTLDDYRRLYERACHEFLRACFMGMPADEIRVRAELLSSAKWNLQVAEEDAQT